MYRAQYLSNVRHILACSEGSNSDRASNAAPHLAGCPHVAFESPKIKDGSHWSSNASRTFAPRGRGFMRATFFAREAPRSSPTTAAHLHRRCRPDFHLLAPTKRRRTTSSPLPTRLYRMGTSMPSCRGVPPRHRARRRRHPERTHGLFRLLIRCRSRSAAVPSPTTALRARVIWRGLLRGRGSQGRMLLSCHGTPT